MKAPPCGYCYVGKASNGEYKIGQSGSPDFRAYQIGVSLGIVFELVICLRQFRLRQGRLERYLHTAFRHRRIRGEWFFLTDADLELIRSIGTCRDEKKLPQEILFLYVKNRAIDYAAEAKKKSIKLAKFFGVAVEDLWSEAKS